MRQTLVIVSLSFLLGACQNAIFQEQKSSKDKGEESGASPINPGADANPQNPAPDNSKNPAGPVPVENPSNTEEGTKVPPVIVPPGDSNTPGDGGKNQGDNPNQGSESNTASQNP